MSDDQLAAAIAASLRMSQARSQSELIEFPPLVGIERGNRRLLVLSASPGDKVFATHPPEISRNGPFEILIKMTVGSFRNYNSRCLLHCGVSDSKGRVFNFDQHGYHEDSYWKESIRVKLPEGEKMGAQKWDEALKTFTLIQKLAGRPYVPLGNNCYDYAVGFLNFIQFSQKSNHTIHSIEHGLLNEPAQRAVKYLEYWKRLSSSPSSCMPYPFHIKGVPSSTVNEGKKGKGAEKEKNKSDDGKEQSVIKVVLYEDGFTLNGGEFRSTSVTENKMFVASLLSGKVPQELQARASAGKLDVDFDDLRPSKYAGTK